MIARCLAEAVMKLPAFDPTVQCPLDGVRVLDLSRLVAGNILTYVLADLGAEVIEIEKPGRGDDLGNWKTKGVTLWWQVYARNKKRLCLDLYQDASASCCCASAARPHVLVEVPDEVAGKLRSSRNSAILSCNDMDTRAPLVNGRILLRSTTAVGAGLVEA
jgi:hypothetical protein